MSLKLNNKFKFIFILIPLNYIIDFFSFTFFHYHIDLHGYILFLQILLFGYWFKNQRYLNITLLIYVLIYSYFYSTGYPLTHKVRYMLAFASTISIMWLIIKDRDKIATISKNNTFIEIFSILFIGLFILSGPFVIHNSQADQRVYLEGFLIPHHIAYYTAILGYFCLNRGKNILGLIILGFGVLTGSRTGLILAILTLIFSIKANFKLEYLLSKHKIKHLSIILLLVSIVSVICYLLFHNIINTQLKYFVNSFKDATLSTDASSQKSFTSYRSIIWISLFDDYLKNPFDLFYFLGHGPISSMSFNKSRLGIEIWMHNDFFDILYCYGYLGCSLFIYTIYKLIKSTKSFYLLLFILISATLNGFIFYDSTQILLLATIIILQNEKRSVNVEEFTNN